MKKTTLRNALYVLAVSVMLVFNMTTAYAGTVKIGAGVSKSPANTSSSSSKYTGAWEYWSQGASKYSGMRSGGCRVTAFSKLIKEAGYARYSNPDDFFTWGIGKGYFKSTSSAYEMTSFGVALNSYISMYGGSCKLVATNSLSNTATDKANMMNYIRQGYYIVLSSSGHTAYVGRAASLNYGAPVILDSWSSWSANPASVHTYTGSYDSMSGASFTKYRVYAVSSAADTTAPTISDFAVTNIDHTGYTVSMRVTDNSGSINRVQFPTWTDANGQDDLAPNWETNSSIRGTISGDRVTYRVKVSDHNYESGSYSTHVYAYDNSGNYRKITTGVVMDCQKPVISNVRISDVNINSYTVHCTVTDNGTIDRVQFPTWTSYNGQNDLIGDWVTNKNCSGTKNGNVYSFTVYRSLHLGELFGYITHIYAYDRHGNYSSAGIECASLIGSSQNLGNSFTAYITNRASGTVLTNDNDNVSGRHKNGSNAQKWKFVRQSDNSYIIYSVSAPDKCLDLQGATDADWTNVFVHPVHGGENQRWKFYKYQEGAYMIIPVSNRVRALDLDCYSSVDGTNVHSWTAEWGLSQIFTVNKIDTTPSQPTKPSQPSQPTTPSQPSQPTKPAVNNPPAVGTVVTSGELKYQVMKNGAGCYAQCIGPVSKNIKSATVKDYVYVGNYKYPVSQIKASAFKSCKKLTKVVIGSQVKTIGGKAFYNCKKLKTITINSTQLSSVNKNAFKKIHTWAKIKVPSWKKTAYKKMLKKSGLAWTVSVK